MNAERFEDLLRQRKSTRQLDTTPVPRATVEAVLVAATLAPSPHNVQPWRFAVVLEAPARRDLADAMLIQWHADLRGDGLADAEIQRRTEKVYQRTLAAPVAILVCLVEAELDAYPDPLRQTAEHAMAVQAIGAAVQNLLLAATAHRLATSWICAPLFCGATVRDSLRLEATWDPQALVLLGHPAIDPRPRERRPVDAITVWR